MASDESKQHDSAGGSVGDGTVPEWTRFGFELFPDRWLHIMYIDALANAGEVRAAIRGRKLDAAVMDAGTVLHSSVVHVAANKAVHACTVGRGTAASAHAELVYCMSPNKGVGYALGTFGVREDSTSVVVAVLDGSAEVLAAVRAAVKGSSAPLAALNALATDDATQRRIAGLYGIGDQELATTVSLQDSVATRIAVRDVLRQNGAPRSGKKKRKLKKGKAQASGNGNGKGKA